MDYNILLELAADMGYRLAMNGAETFRIEESIRRILAAYDIDSEVFAIPNCLTVSIIDGNAQPMTRMRRIGFHGNDLDAVEKFKESKEGTYDLIFMDIRMPVMKGDEATATIRSLDREDSKRIPIIAMTANALESDVENSYRCGMNGHISKPIEPRKVFESLSKWIS